MASFPDTRASLILRIADARNARAWDEFARLYQPVVYRLARRRGFHHADAEDLKNRETELTKREERLTKLRAQLERRQKAKADIIQLQIKVMVNEAEGLGFSGASVFDAGSHGITLLGAGRGGAGGFGASGYGPPPGAIVRPVPTLPQAKP